MLFPSDRSAEPAAVDATPPLLAHLNPEQLAAITLPDEPALILAGAGSGKTRVLTTRMAWLLHQGRVSPGGLMAVTFTNKAAKEMLTRLQALLPISVRGMWVGTFHGLCNRLLRAHHQLAGLPAAFQILDTQDQLSAIKRVCKQFHVDEERYPPKQLQWFIASCKEDGMRPNEVHAPHRTPDEALKKKIEIYQLYEEQCNREGVVDFGELMLRTYELLRDHEAVRLHYRRRFRHILIDEFQDTNRLQYTWIKLLAGLGDGGVAAGDGLRLSAVFAVGDDDQSIYAFRGARVGNMADFVRDFGVRHPIKLEENYRSHGHILDAANALIGHNEGRLGKNLRTSQGPGEPVRAQAYASDLEEARQIVEEMQQLADVQRMPRSQMAVLYRSNAQSRVIETALFNANVPYRVYGGLRFFERAEIKHALAYLRLLEAPGDDTSFLRVVNFPPRGIGARSIEQLQDAARAHRCALAEAVDGLSGKAGTHLRAFVAGLDVLREQTQGRTLREIIELMLAHSGLMDHYRQDKDGADRVENLEELVNAAESFVMQEGFGRDAVAMPLDETRPPAQAVEAALSTQAVADGETLSPLAAFLTHAALEAGDNQASAGQDAVQLMTVHAAKGLEFDAVFIAGLEEGLFPHENSLSTRDGLEEERRLMYVAITRARQRLYISHSHTRMLHGQTRYNLRSRFFDELPEAALKWLSPPQGLGMALGLNGGQGSWGQGGWRATGAGMRPAWTPSTGTASPHAGAAPLQPRTASGPNAWVRSGVQAFHHKFGEGTVLAVEGAGDDARAQVKFNRHGVKWLALSVAKLTPIEG